MSLGRSLLFLTPHTPVTGFLIGPVPLPMTGNVPAAGVE
jgi:hypothetical protein